MVNFIESNCRDVVLCLRQKMAVCFKMALCVSIMFMPETPRVGYSKCMKCISEV